MGLFDFLTGTKRPPKGVAPKSTAEVRAALLAVNRDTAPFLVRDGSAEGADLVAEWRIVDATWYEVFAKAGLQKVFKVLMRLDAERNEVRAVDQELSSSGLLARRAFRLWPRRFAARRPKSPLAPLMRSPSPGPSGKSTATSSRPAKSRRRCKLQ